MVVAPRGGEVVLKTVVALLSTSVARWDRAFNRRKSRRRGGGLTSSRLRAIKEYSSSTCCSNLVINSWEELMSAEGMTQIVKEPKIQTKTSLALYSTIRSTRIVYQQVARPFKTLLHPSLRPRPFSSLFNSLRDPLFPSFPSSRHTLSLSDG